MTKQRGFTLIELLIVVAIIGIIAAIAIPNLLDAIERSRQKRSTSEVKSLANSMQSFSTDYGGYPMGHDGDPAVTWLFNDAVGSPAIVPDYIQAVPPMDGWKVPYLFNSNVPSATINPQLGEVVATHFTLGCTGNDRADGGGTDVGVGAYATMATNWNAAAPTNVGTLQTHCYQSDIVWGDSSFLQAPDGKQKNC